ncbi:MAG: NAD(P)-dependent oxidoreductase [Gammaproteobacteria bacterium]|nr:NAD(P)-dependent oxidoreductase [Gammaproteobacteria bacterium]
MHDALIGYTGFVGGNLLAQRDFDDTFNSKNIEAIDGREYDTIICAGAPAEKWKANKEPESDLATINRLIENLARAKARKLILISTVDVYLSPRDVDEATPIDPAELHAYGRHRRMLEEFAINRFDTLTVRLPGLFGDGLKKNAIYDFIHDNNVEQLHSEGVFQFYGLDNLWRDIQVALNHRVDLINFATEPVSLSEIAHHVFSRDFQNLLDHEPANYDMKSRHACLYSGTNGYLYDKGQVLSQMRDFVARCPGENR